MIKILGANFLQLLESTEITDCVYWSSAKDASS